MTVERKLVDYDPLTGVREDYVYDHADDKIRLVQSQDVAGVLEEAARLRKASIGWKGNFVHVAHISAVQALELMKLGIMDRGYAVRDEAAFAVWLSENDKLKITEGHF